MMYANNMGGGGWVVSIVGTLFIVALVIVAVVWFVSSRHSSPLASTGSASEILDRRLASGEISSEHYHELRQTLSATTASGAPANPAGAPR
jgi:uncharacterized membrane protein